MNHSSRIPDGGDRQKLQIWYCSHCNAVHFDFGSVTVNFTRSEFDQLMRVGVEIYAEQYGEEAFRELVGVELPIEEEDGILMSDIVL